MVNVLGWWLPRTTAAAAAAVVGDAAAAVIARRTSLLRCAAHGARLVHPLGTVNYCVRTWTTTSCNCCKLLANPNRSQSHRLSSHSLNTNLSTVRWQEPVILSITRRGPFRFSGCTATLLCKLCIQQHTGIARLTQRLPLFYSASNYEIKQ